MIVRKFLVLVGFGLLCGVLSSVEGLPNPMGHGEHGSTMEKGASEEDKTIEMILEKIMDRILESVTKMEPIDDAEVIVNETLRYFFSFTN